MIRTLAASIGLIGLLALAPGPFAAVGQEPATHVEWVASAIQHMETIKVGMSRDDLLRVFRGEGGLSRRDARRFSFRDCPYFKVDVTFTPVDAVNDTREYPSDRIASISRPFVERPILD
jgi:hypothetical protein